MKNGLKFDFFDIQIVNADLSHDPLAFMGNMCSLEDLQVFVVNFDKYKSCHRLDVAGVNFVYLF